MRKAISSFASLFGRRPIFTVAWGRPTCGRCPPRNRVVHHPVSWLKVRFTLRVALEVNMAVGQNHGFANIRPGALPQATVMNGLRPNECAQNSWIRNWPGTAEAGSERPHPACPDGESGGELANLRKGSRPPRACHEGEADLLAKRLSAALANRLIHHPDKLHGVSCDLRGTTRAGTPGYDESKCAARPWAPLFHAVGVVNASPSPHWTRHLLLISVHQRSLAVPVLGFNHSRP
jgi:hypothetical protein